MKSHTGGAIEASLLYLANKDYPAIYMASEAGGDVPEHLGEYQRQTVLIENARALNSQLNKDKLNLDCEGFGLIDQISQVTDFYDDDQIEAIYEAEVKASVAQALEALGENIEHTEIFDHTRRTSSDAMRRQLKIREPASIIHNDYTDKSALRTRDEFLKKDRQLSEKLKNKRFLIINIWRSINGVVEQAPMTLCAANSIEKDDIVSTKRVAENHEGELQLAVWNANHRWYYFPKMNRREALIFKTFDSATDGRARYTIHTAFDNPTSATDSPPRESIETRCLVFLE